MKILNAFQITLLIAVCFLSNTAFSQDKIKISFESPSEKEKIVNSLNDIQLLELKCTDMKAEGKLFALDIVRFQKGIADTVYTNYANCDEMKFPVVMPSGDTAFYIHKPCERITFKGGDDSMSIILALKYQDSLSKMSISYNYSSSKIELKGNPFFVLQNALGGKFQEVPLNTPTPVALYFGGYQQGNGRFFCLAKTAKSEEMYQDFQVEDYYVFYLTIK